MLVSPTGGVAQAQRFDRRRLGGAIDTWLITTHAPVLVVGAAGEQLMRTQFLLTLAHLIRLPGGDRPLSAEPATHVLAMGTVSGTIQPDWMTDWVRPTVTGDQLLYVEFEALGDHTARAVSRAVATAFTTGLMPLQGRHVAWAFDRCVRAVALALSQVTFAPNLHV